MQLFYFSVKNHPHFCHFVERNDLAKMSHSKTGEQFIKSNAELMPNNFSL